MKQYELMIYYRISGGHTIDVFECETDESAVRHTEQILGIGNAEQRNDPHWLVWREKHVGYSQLHNVMFWVGGKRINTAKEFNNTVYGDFTS